MLAVQILFVAFLTAVAAAVLAILVRIMRDADRRRLLTGTWGTLCDAPEGIGVSVLCSGVTGFDEVRELLDVGYSRYEAIVVLDSLRSPGVFAAIVSEYHLIDVNFTPSAELPVEGVRGLYRSRKRAFRRLVLVDKAFSAMRDDFDAAVGVAIYDYVLPLRAGVRMSPDCIGRLVVELSLEPTGSVELVRTFVGEPLLLVGRETVVAAGGFGPGLVRRVPRARRRMLYEPLLVRSGSDGGGARRSRSFAAGALAVGIVAAAMARWWEVCAVLLTMAIVAVAAEYARFLSPERRTMRASSRKSL